MLALGASAQDSVKKQIAALGSNRLMIQPQPQNTAGVRQQRGAVSRLTVDEATHIDGRIATITGVTGMVSGRGQIVYGDKNANTQLEGTMPGYQVVYSAPTIYGRFYTMEECENRARVAVLGETVVSELFGTDDPVGKMGADQFDPVPGHRRARPQGRQRRRRCRRHRVDSPADRDVPRAGQEVCRLDRRQRGQPGRGRPDCGRAARPHPPVAAYSERRRRQLPDPQLRADDPGLQRDHADTLAVPRLRGGDLAGGRRHRHHEHHAGFGDGTDARDRPAQGARRARRATSRRSF